MENSKIADALDELAGLLEFRGENPFRVRAYRNAARSIGDLGARFVITAEASDADELDALRFSIGFARRAGLEPAQVLNAGSFTELTPWLDDHRCASRR